MPEAEPPRQVSAGPSAVRAGKVGAPRRARPLYRIADPYLAFWFAVLYADLGLIQGGQGKAVLRQAAPRWQRHLGGVVEGLARAHAARLVARGELPESVVGRWWTSSGPPAEVDVLGLAGRRTVLVGEARWQVRPPGRREVAALRRLIPFLPDPASEVVAVLWGRAGAAAEVAAADARSYDVTALVAG